MPEVTIRQMFEAGIHFGHRARFWNPKMAPYIYAERNKIHIINLDRTLPLFRKALAFLKNTAKEGKTVVFVGTKRAAQEAIRDQAERCGIPYVEQRWLGGTLTNFKTVNQSIRRYISLEEEYKKTDFRTMSKKERLLRTREFDKLRRLVYGIRNIRRVPDALFVIDVRHENIAVKEAAKLGIPVVAIVDTNNSLDRITYPVPGNDDAISAVELYASAAADAILEGIEEGRKNAEYTDAAGEEAAEENVPVVAAKVTLKKASRAPSDGGREGINSNASDDAALTPPTVDEQKPGSTS